VDTTLAGARGALRLPPWRYVASRWPWWSLGYLVSTVPVGVLTLLLLGLALLLGALGAVVVVGLLLLAEIPVLTAAIAVVERRRLRLLGAPVPGLGMRDAVRAARRRQGSWTEVGYALLLGIVLWVLDLVILQAAALPVVLLLAPALTGSGTAVDLPGWHVATVGQGWTAAGVGLVLVVPALYLVGAVAVAQGALARALLVPSDEDLAAALRDLRRSRVDLVDAFETERRRIERDLHDGVQQRLLALTMTLGRAELDVPEGPGRDAVRAAQLQAEQALEDLRGTVRGIHPRVLADHGLAAAVHEIADRCSVPVAVDIRLAGRLPAPVEAAAYFVVSEALSNVAKHAAADRATVEASRRGDRLVLTVCDDGRGGARVDGTGSGLAGLALRLEALDGELVVTSPEGGPTEVRMVCPC
jgi:signal transduction histidine kinase